MDPKFISFVWSEKRDCSRAAWFLNDQVRGHFQVPVCKSYLDPLSLATWMCFLATLQCAVMAFFLEANYIEIWKLASIWELPCILYGVSFGPFECTCGVVIHIFFLKLRSYIMSLATQQHWTIFAGRFRIGRKLFYAILVHISERPPLQRNFYTAERGHHNNIVYVLPSRGTAYWEVCRHFIPLSVDLLNFLFCSVHYHCYRAWCLRWNCLRAAY